MNEGILGWIQTLTALIVALLALYQWWEATRWRKGEEGRKLVDDLFLSEQHEGYYALVMIDLPEGKEEEFEDDWLKKKVATHKISHKDVMEALKARPPLTDKAAFIQACFDDLFYYLERIAFFLEKRFVKYEDVCSPLGYYAERMAKDSAVYKQYMEVIRADRAVRFLKRLEEEGRKGKQFPDTASEIKS